jgi:hypothetical protein
METIKKATPAQIERAVELMEETGTDLIGVIEHVILDTEHFHLDDAQILSWFPEDFVRLAIEWLESELNEEEC